MQTETRVEEQGVKLADAPGLMSGVGSELWVVEGSHLYVRGACGGDVFLDWDEVPEESRKKALEAKEIEKNLSAAADGLYRSLVEASVY